MMAQHTWSMLSSTVPGSEYCRFLSAGKPAAICRCCDNIETMQVKRWNSNGVPKHRDFFPEGKKELTLASSPALALAILTQLALPLLRRDDALQALHVFFPDHDGSPLLLSALDARGAKPLQHADCRRAWLGAQVAAAASPVVRQEDRRRWAHTQTCKKTKSPEKQGEKQKP